MASPNNQLIKLTLEQIEHAGLICMAADIPFAVWGPVGIGKTAIVKQIAKKTGRKLYILRVSDKLPQDLGGTPMPVTPEDKDGKPRISAAYLKYLMASGMIPFVTPDRPDEDSILFIDEIDRTDNQDTQNTAFQFLDGDGVDGAGRGVNGNMLVKGCRVVVAGNGGTDQYTTPLSEAFRRRVVHFYVEMETDQARESWDKWADEAGISGMMRGYFREKWASVMDLNNKTRNREITDLALANPDSFVKVDKLVDIANNPKLPFKTKDILPALIQGAIGHAAAVEFKDYMAWFGTAPTIAEIIADPQNVHVPDPDVDKRAQGIFYPLTHSLVPAAKRDRATAIAIATYGLRWPAEPKAYLFRELVAKYPEIATTDPYMVWSGARTTVKPGVVAKPINPKLNNHLPALAKLFPGGKPLPENDGWHNRIQITSDSDPTRHYIVSQSHKDVTWMCSCRGWTSRRICKHIEKIPATLNN